MENSIKELLEKPNKTIFLNKNEDQIFIITKIRLHDDLDLIELDLIQSDKKYLSLVMEKGEVFPIPNEYNIISVDKLSLKYDPE